MECNNTVSIIMPVYNEEKYIRECLDSLLKQTYKNIVEILIVDGMSVDATREIVNEYAVKNNTLMLLDNPKRTQASALNVGIKMAKGDIVVRVDAHAFYHEDYILNSVYKLNALKDQDVVNVGGPTYLVKTEDYIQNSIIFLHESKFGIGVAKFRQKDYEGFVDTIWNGAFWRSIFDEIGLYNEELFRSEDNDMNSRILASGHKVYQSKDIIAYYRPRTTVGNVLKQNYENGRAIGNSIISNPKIIRIRHIVPVCFVLSIFAVVITWNYLLVSRFLGSFIFASYFGIDLLESIKTSKKEGIKYLPIMFVLFFLLHFAYGLGTIAGFFQQIFGKKE